MSKIECIFCGEENNPNENFCKNCNAELVTDIKISKDDSVIKTDTSPRKIVILESIQDGKVIRIEKTSVIGRMGNIETEYFYDKPYFSREQFRICIDDKITIEHLSHTTPTRLNKVKLIHGEPVTLRNRSVIRVADRNFLVSIEDVCEEKEKAIKWVIRCPHCNKKYYGDTPDFHIDECNGPCLYSDDEYIRYEISKVIPIKEE